MTDDEKRELADVYEKAAEYLEEYGWSQGKDQFITYGEEGGPRCIMGAIQSAGGYGQLRELAAEFFAEVLELDYPINEYASPAVRPIRWNDEPGRTKDEVVNTLLGLANKLR